MKLNTLHSYSLKKEESIELIKHLLKSNQAYYNSVRIRLVAVRDNQKWYNVMCVIKVISKNAGVKRNPSLLYDHIHFLEVWVEMDGLLNFLTQLDKSEIIIEDKHILIGDHTYFSDIKFLHHDNPFMSTPGYYFSSFSVSSHFNIPRGPLLSHKLPFYSDVNIAIQAWSEFSDLTDNDGRLKRIYLLLPECRAYFSELKYVRSKSALSVSVQKNLGSLKLYLKGAYNYKSTTHSLNKQLTSSKSIFLCPIKDSEKVDEFEIYLIDKDNHIYDYHKENKYDYQGLKRVFRIKVESNLERWVKQALNLGECVEIEFKPYVRGEPKVNEIIETVIAFANTKGGFIFIGIDKHMDIIGIERDIIKERKGSESIKSLISNYMGYLRKVISDHITKPLPIQIYNHQSEDHDIVIIYVPPGSYRPYAWFRRNDIFIRKGANNVKPDPDTELPTLKGLRVL